jgi:hypothetical protein
MSMLSLIAVGCAGEDDTYGANALIRWDTIANQKNRYFVGTSAIQVPSPGKYVITFSGRRTGGSEAQSTFQLFVGSTFIARSNTIQTFGGVGTVHAVTNISSVSNTINVRIAATSGSHNLSEMFLSAIWLAF